MSHYHYGLSGYFQPISSVQEPRARPLVINASLIVGENLFQLFLAQPFLWFLDNAFDE